MKAFVSVEGTLTLPAQVEKFNYGIVLQRGGTREASWLIVSRLVFHNLSEYPTENDRGNSDKLSNHKNGLSAIALILAENLISAVILPIVDVPVST